MDTSEVTTITTATSSGSSEVTYSGEINSITAVMFPAITKTSICVINQLYAYSLYLSLYIFLVAS